MKSARKFMGKEFLNLKLHNLKCDFARLENMIVISSFQEQAALYMGFISRSINRKVFSKADDYLCNVIFVNFLDGIVMLYSRFFFECII